MRKLTVMTAMILALAMCAFAQTTTPTSPKTTTKTTKTPKAMKTMKTKPTDDAGIQQCIEGRLAKSKMAGEGFQASVNGGAATFTGATKVAGHKGGVSGISKSCGAKSIVNNITVEGKAAKSMKKSDATGDKMSDSKMNKSKMTTKKP